MVHVIPLSIAQRRLDTGNAPQYPQGSPIGGAMQGFGDHLSAAAERYQQMKDQQEAFDAELARRRFNGQIAQAEDEVTANAPADGAGLHEAMYGQVDPYSGRVVKTGLFDKLFAAALPNMPESQRAAFARQKETMRHTGGRRMAARQLQRRKDYEQAEVDTALKTSAIAIGNANPDDRVTFEAARQQGLDLIDKMGLDPAIRQQKVKDWFSTAAKARFEALIAKDPKRALEMFGAGAPGESSGGDASGASQITWVLASGSSEASAATGDRVGKLTPDQRVAPAFRDDIPPQDRPALAQKALAADAARQVEMRTGINLAEQNASAAIRETGTYSGPTPTLEQFVAVYGATEGIRRFRAFDQAMDVGRQFHGMRGMSNEAVRAMVKESSPKTDSGTPEEDSARHDAIATAADLTLKERRGDPGGYVRKTFTNLDAAWNNLSTPEDYQTAIIGSIAAQQQLGFEGIQPLPNSVAGGVVDGLKNGTKPQDQTLSNIFAALPTQTFQEAMLDHLLRTSAAQTERSLADRTRRDAMVDPKMLIDLRKAAVLGLRDSNVEATNYIPTLQDRIGRFAAGDSKPGSARQNLTVKLLGSAGGGEEGFSLSDLTPLGAVFAADKAGTSARYGDYGDMVLNVAGALPVEQLASVGLKQAGKIAGPLVKELSQVLRRSDDLAEGAEALVRGGNGKLANSAEEVLSEGADLYKGADDLPNPGPELVAEGAGGAGASPAPTGQFYSVVFETRLDPALYPNVSRPRHFQAANEALLVLMEREPDFAKILQEAGINLQRTKRGLVPRRAPPGYTWHHDTKAGVMQLVPRSQHDPGTIFQKALHPNRRGGFSLWGK
ncbi:HNH endonuclease [Mesorhizobium sp. B2-4-19]|uniref:HNH endonuclease n=1 Tax=Mesorhizobium sp. B2-4-19 TaxID=2589930 RepID=UPI0015E3D7E1|nr:HNH endonuclease [Mesorhizobium sp. B2-4-19]